MKSFFTFIVAGLALATTGSLLAETPSKDAAPAAAKEQPAAAAPAEAAPTETKDKVSYAFGVIAGSNLKKEGLDLNPEFVARGLRDFLSGKMAMSEEEIKSTLQAWQGEMQAKEEAAAIKNKEAADKFLEANKKKEGVTTTASGIQYRIIKKGDGPKPAATDTVVVNYKGTLVDGTVFDSSEKHGGPASFEVGGVIHGFSEALQMMPLHSKWEVVIPPDLAYGMRAPAAIGPNQALIFEIELLEIKKPAEQSEPAAPEKSPAAK